MVKFLAIFLSFLIGTLSKAEQKHFVIDVCSYNNKEWCQRNLLSVFNQRYSNYRIVYTNDCSSDGTGELVEQLVQEYGNNVRVTLIHNDQRNLMLANHWRVIHQCDDHEIIVHLDGDDWFAHDHVLEVLNEAYQDDTVWMTYGSYAFWPSGEPYVLEPIPDRVIRSGSYRKGHFRKSPYHPRTFYAWLAQQVKLEDLLFTARPFTGCFIPAISDWSLLYPLFEMAAGKFKYIPDVLYSFNVINPLNHDKNRKTLELQHRCAAFICRKKPYRALDGPLMSKRITRELCDVVVESNDSQQTRKLCASIEKWVDNFCRIIVVNNDEYDNHDFNEYVFFIRDTSVVEQRIDVVSCCALLEATKAHAFYLQVQPLTIPCVWLIDDVYGFKYHYARSFMPRACIGRREDFHELREKLRYNHPLTRFDEEKVGLVWVTPKIARNRWERGNVEP